MRLVKDRRDGQSVRRFEANDAGFDEVFGVDLRAERIGQPCCLGRTDPARVKVRGGAVAIQGNDHPFFVTGEDDRSHVAFWQLGHRNKTSRFRIVNADDSPPVVVYGRDAVAPIAREAREGDVPVGRLDVFVLSGC